MESIVDAVHNEIDRYSNPKTKHCKFSEPSCDAMMLGLLFRAFRETQIYPEASVVTTKSVEEVKRLLQMIEFPEFIPINKPTGCCKSPQATKSAKATQSPVVFSFIGENELRSRQSLAALGGESGRASGGGIGGAAGGAAGGTPPGMFSPPATQTTSAFGTPAAQTTTAFGGPGITTTGTTGGLFAVPARSNTPPTSLFGTPASTTTPAGGLFAGAVSDLRITKAPTCSKCQKPYQPLKGVDVSHAEHCLPLTRLKKNLDDIVARVTGLEYSQFVRRTSDREQATSAKQASTDRWSTVEYIEVPMT